MCYRFFVGKISGNLASPNSLFLKIAIKRVQYQTCLNIVECSRKSL